MKISREFSEGPRKEFSSKRGKRIILCLGAALLLAAAPPRSMSQQDQSAPARLELSRTVRPWEFLPITGTRAALFGDESGTMEAWVYPLKIFREFHLNFLTEGRVLPAALGASYIDWNWSQRAFYFGEEQRKFSAFVGSPTAADPHAEFQTNYAESQTSSFRLGATAKGKDTKLIVIAASMEGHDAALKTYQHLTADYAALQQEASKYYQDYLARTVTLDLPDAQIQQAYDWARI